MTARAGEHDVSSALEIAGNDMVFPKTGATVRAVPIADISAQAHNPTSRPGDTYWKGAQGTIPGKPAPPPDIILVCKEEDDMSKAPGKELLVTWDMSWSDVLDMLRFHYGRAVVFTYSGVNSGGRKLNITVASEKEFDVFCSHAEKYENRYDVRITNAKFRPSDFITGALDEQFPMHPVVKKRAEPIDEEAIMKEAAIQRMREKAGQNGNPLMALPGDEEEEPPEEKSRLTRLLNTFDDAPYPITHMLAFGGLGLTVSCFAVVYGYWTDLNTLAAITLALPVNIFVMSFFVPAVEDGLPSLLRLGIGFTGFFASIICIACFSVTRELIALAASFIWLLSSFWYVEITTKARGWPSWFTGEHLVHVHVYSCVCVYIYIYINTYVCMYVFVYVCMCLCVYVYTHFYTSFYTSAYVHTHTHIHTHTYIHTRTSYHTPCFFAHIFYVCLTTCAYVHAHAHAHIYAHNMHTRTSYHTPCFFAHIFYLFFTTCEHPRVLFVMIYQFLVMIQHFLVMIYQFSHDISVLTIIITTYIYIYFQDTCINEHL
jgi:hypothetical protein